MQDKCIFAGCLSQRGSLGLGSLLILAFLALVIFTTSIYTNKQVSLEQERITGQQLSLLVNTAFPHIAAKENLNVGKHMLWQGALYPGNEILQLKSNVAFSQDGVFRHLELSACTNNGAERVLQQLSFNLDEEQRALAQDYVLVSPQLEGENYLSGSSIYTSKGKVTLPKVDFLLGRSITSIELDSFKNHGIAQRFYYLNTSSRTLSLQGSIYGNGFIGCGGNLIFRNGIKFPGRIILISNGDITLYDKTKFDKVLIVAGGQVTIYPGCEIKGLIIARKKIVLKGVSSFAIEPKCVAPFFSIATPSITL